MNSFLKQCWNYILQLTLARRPSDAVMIDHLSWSFGNQWYVEAPMRDCYLEVVAVKQHGLKLNAIITHVTMNLEDEDELLSDKRICGTEWNYTLDLLFNIKKLDWEFVNSDFIDSGEKQIWIEEASDPDRCYSAIFADFDWHEYLNQNGITSDELMSRFSPSKQRFYQKHHLEILSE